MKENRVFKTGITLALETSGRVGSVAIGRDREILAQLPFSGFMRQAAEWLPCVRRMLASIQAAPADIRTVIITVGPGSFTGLRIAVTAAKMFYFTQQAQIVAVDSTDVLAQNAPETVDGDTVDCVCTVLDAKRHTFYASLFERAPDGWTKVFGTGTVTASALLDRLAQSGKRVYFLGEGLVYYADQFRTPFTVILDEEYWMPRAAGLYRVGQTMAARGQFANPQSLTPLYLRKPDAAEPKTR